jgi:hypothetical protein
MRPPVPIITGVGRGLPVEMVIIEGDPISVRVRPLGLLLRNSCTFPLTNNESPTFTVGAELVKTKMPSEVSSFASGLGSWK